MEAQKIIITGGATRIGAAIARSLSGINKDIVIHYNKSKSKAEVLKKELQKNGSKVYLVKGDLSKETDVNKIIKFSETYSGKVININFPDISKEEYKGVKATELSKRDVPAKPIKIEDQSLSKETYRYRYNLSGEPIKGDYVTDAEAVMDGYVSISVLDYSLGSSEFIDNLSEIINE